MMGAWEETLIVYRGLWELCDKGWSLIPRKAGVCEIAALTQTFRDH